MGIAICPIISKLFEYCFIEKYGEYLSTDNINNLDSKKVWVVITQYTLSNKLLTALLRGGYS